MLVAIALLLVVLAQLSRVWGFGLILNAGAIN
jgi:hypothetical protein